MMIKMTQSFRYWLFENHNDIFVLVMMGHLEYLTNDMFEQYLAWCQTDDGKQYLKGGSKYKEEDDD